MSDRLGRRDLLKLGAGVVATTLQGPAAAAQRAASTENVIPEGALPVLTQYGYRNDANRLDGNDHMDDTTRTIVRYVSSFSDANLTDSLVRALNRTMVDSMACVMAGFEEPPVRIAARLAAATEISERARFKSTVMGYGIPTTPELAAFANSVMVRMTDFNDHGPAAHASDLIPGVLALGEAVHASGSQVMAAITVGYELRAAGIAGNIEAGAAAMAAGKVLGLSEDRLANALSLAVIPHVPLNKGEGHLTMWKGCRSAEAVKNGVWAALMAREGMTGPPAPFEGVGGRWALFGRQQITLPVSRDKTVLERQGFKRFPLEASAQAVLELVPEMRAWTKVEDIAEIRHFMPFDGWTEIGDAPKFDPQNRETADHSIVYLLCRSLMDGELYLDSFTRAKYMDPTLRALMAKMTVSPVRGWKGNGPARTIIRKRNGEQRVWDTLGGRRTAEIEGQAAFNSPMTDEEITAKFNRAAAFMKVSNTQRDQARAVWGNIRALKDIGDAIRTLAKFGQPMPLLVALLCAIASASCGWSVPVFAQTETVTGRVIDLACYVMNKEDVGMDHTTQGGATPPNRGLACAYSCVRWQGMPAGLLTSDGKIYQIAGGLAANSNVRIAPYLTRTVTITGKVTRKDVVTLIAADAVKEVK